MKPVSPKQPGTDFATWDTIDIEDLSVRTIIGIFEEERSCRQELLLSIRMYTDIRPAAASDAIEDALDYKGVTKRLIAFVEQTKFFLIETMAEQVAALLLEEFGPHRVTVRIEKPGALRYARTVAVTITREQS